jgi:hypothetical protein
MASKQNISAENLQISVEMGVFALTKRSGRLNVDIGAVLRTRMNTGVLSQADKSSAVQVAGDGSGMVLRHSGSMLNTNFERTKESTTWQRELQRHSWFA